MKPYADLNKSYINGRWKDGAGRQTVDNLNPYNQETLFSFQTASESDIDEAYEAAQAAQIEWAKTTPSYKRNIFDKAIRIMEDRKDEITAWMVRESGSTLLKAATEWGISYEAMCVAAAYPYTMKGEIIPSMNEGRESRVYRTPRGVITVITPWNFAMNLSMRSIALF